VIGLGYKEDIGIKIRTMRKSRKMTQEDLAKAIDQSPSSITMYETGRREPNFETLEALADVFNVSLFEFIPVAETDANFVDEFEYEEEKTAPKILEARILATGIDKMPKSQREAILKMMTGLYPGLFEKGTEQDDTDT
jgi:transcriptional regulator with XRE-family HTH domain